MHSWREVTEAKKQKHRTESLGATPLAGDVEMEGKFGCFLRLWTSLFPGNECYNIIRLNIEEQKSRRC